MTFDPLFFHIQAATIVDNAVSVYLNIKDAEDDYEPDYETFTLDLFEKFFSRYGIDEDDSDEKKGNLIKFLISAINIRLESLTCEMDPEKYRDILDLYENLEWFSSQDGESRLKAALDH